MAKKIKCVCKKAFSQKRDPVSGRTRMYKYDDTEFFEEIPKGWIAYDAVKIIDEATNPETGRIDFDSLSDEVVREARYDMSKFLEYLQENYPSIEFHPQMAVSKLISMYLDDRAMRKNAVVSKSLQEVMGGGFMGTKVSLNPESKAGKAAAKKAKSSAIEKLLTPSTAKPPSESTITETPTDPGSVDDGLLTLDDLNQ